MEFTLLPTWANVIAVIAILGIIGSAFMPKVKNLNMATTGKTAYYITAVSVAVALATVFLTMAGIDTSGGVFTAYGIILFCGLLASAFGAMDIDDHKFALFWIGGIVIVCLIFATLAFSNVAFAAIWLAVIGALFFVGQLLFPTKKEKK